MNDRHCIWLCVFFCLYHAAAVGLADPRNGDAQPKTLEQLKIDGARQSAYRRVLPESGTADAETPQANLETFHDVVQPVLNQACVSCHGPDTVEGNIRIDTLSPDLIDGKDVDWWLEVLSVLSNGEMPPPDADPLKEEDRTRVIEWLSDEIQVASKMRRATGGHSSFRRMTRYEYNYALQDLLGLPWNFAKDLPPEAHSDDGFQNSSEMLHMSVTQLETYRQVAREALRRATVMGDRPPVIHWGITMAQAADKQRPQQEKELENLKKRFKDDPEKQTREIDRLLASRKKAHSRPYYRNLSTGDTAKAEWRYSGAKFAFKPTDTEPEFPDTFDHVAIIPSGRNQNLTVELGHRIPDEGMMRVRVRASRTSTEEHRIPSLQLEFGFQASNEGKAVVRVSDQDTPIAATTAAPQIYEWSVPLGEIYPRNSFRKTAKMGGLPSPSEFIRFVNSSVPEGRHGDIQIDYVEVATPVYEAWPPASHKRIFIDSQHRNDESVYAREVLAALLSRAWRQALSDDDIDQKLKLFHAIREDCDSFEEAMVEVLATVLSSPRFLYVVRESERSEAASRGEVPAASGHVEHATDIKADQVAAQLSPYELATRLSMFLWCSVPDEPLLQAANSGRLSDTEMLSQQVTRMLTDPRSERFAKHFVHQWLDMQLLDFLAVQKNADPLLKESMHREPIAFFQEVLRNDESVLNFIHADYTMANERLARHYGLPDVQGNHFRRVSLKADDQRGGLLTQAGLLAMNSNGKDSHPLKRGVWLLESLLNDPPPPPPPAVPEIDLADPEIAKLTLKQQIEDHRNHPACMSCHAKIDPWGIAFENYDALGRWRTQIDGNPVDSASVLFNDQKLDGMDGLKRFLLQNRQDQFVRALVHKMATYALGRPLTFSDHSAANEITANVRENGDGLETMIGALVTSELFRSE